MVGRIITHKHKIPGTNGLRGWFEIAGQAGVYKLEERLVGLQSLEPLVKDATILDLGCAEGLVGLHFMEAGPAALLHGIDDNPAFLSAAWMIAQDRGVNARFFDCDLNRHDWIVRHNPGELLQSYDVVLCLCLAHKMENPERLLRQTAALCGSYLALQLPATIIDDPRSDHRLLDTHALLVGALGFDLFHEDTRALPASRRIYRRRT